MIVLLVVGVLALVGVAGAISAVTRDGYRSVPTREDYDTRHPVP